MPLLLLARMVVASTAFSSADGLKSSGMAVVSRHVLTSSRIDNHRFEFPAFQPWDLQYQAITDLSLPAAGGSEEPIDSVMLWSRRRAMI